jgi:hypothetical protein
MRKGQSDLRHFLNHYSAELGEGESILRAAHAQNPFSTAC